MKITITVVASVIGTILGGMWFFEKMCDKYDEFP